MISGILRVMKDSTLLPILKSQTQADLLALLFLNPGEEFSVTDVARRISCSVPGAHHEVVRLLGAGFISERREGNRRLVSAVTGSVMSDGLTMLLTATHGPLPVLTRALEAVSGVLQAFIFGEWAERYLGIPGAVPTAVRVLVVGKVDENSLTKISRESRALLNREVNICLVSQADWKSNFDSIFSSVCTGPLIGLTPGSVVPSSMSPLNVRVV